MSDYIWAKDGARRHLSKGQQATLYGLLREAEIKLGLSSVQTLHLDDAGAGDTTDDPPTGNRIDDIQAGTGASRRTAATASKLISAGGGLAKDVVDGRKSIAEATREAEAEKHPAPPAPSAERVDSRGVRIPPELFDAFDGTWNLDVKTAREAIHTVARLIEGLRVTPAERCIVIDRALEHADAIKDMLRPKFIAAHCVCPVCGGDAAIPKLRRKCKPCLDRGWVTLYQFKNAVADEFKK